MGDCIANLSFSSFRMQNSGRPQKHPLPKVPPAKKPKSNRTMGKRGQLRINPKHRRLPRVKGQPRRVQRPKLSRSLQRVMKGTLLLLKLKITVKRGKRAAAE